MRVSFRDEDFKTTSMCVPTTQWNCVTVAMRDGIIGVRDTKDTTKTTLVFTRDEWGAFIEGVKKGEFDIIK